MDSALLLPLFTQPPRRKILRSWTSVFTEFSEVGLRVALTVSASGTLREPLRPYVRRGADLPSQRLAPFIGHIRDHDLGALLGEPAHGREAEAASAAGDDRRSVGEVHKSY